MPRVSEDAATRLHDLPEDVPWLRTSERSTWKRCPQKWWWSYREGLSLGEYETPNALWFGIGIHEALAHYYQPGAKRNNDMVELWDKYAEDSRRHIATTQDGTWDDKDWVDAAELGHAMLTGYIEKYQGDPDWDVIYTEEPFAIEIPHLHTRTGKPTSRTEAIFISTFDGVYRSRKTKKVILMEHKTAAAISDAHLALDDQGGAYWALASNVLREKGILGAKERIAGINYNYLRKAMPDARPLNRDGYATNKPVKEHYVAALLQHGVDLTGKESVATLQSMAEGYRLRVVGEVSKTQPKPLFERFEVLRTAAERREQIMRISREAAAMNAQRSGKLPIWKTPTRDCKWQCQFYNLCELQDRGEDIETFKKLAFTVNDPYADRRKSASE